MIAIDIIIKGSMHIAMATNKIHFFLKQQLQAGI
jgi:hypothetical protein